MQNNSVNKSIFYFLGARIWVPIPVYRYENRSEYVADYRHVTLRKNVPLYVTFFRSKTISNHSAMVQGVHLVSIDPILVGK